MMALEKCLVCVVLSDGCESQVFNSTYTNTISHVERIEHRNILCLLHDSAPYSAPAR